MEDQIPDNKTCKRGVQKVKWEKRKSLESVFHPKKVSL